MSETPGIPGDLETLEVVRVVVEGEITSFRYPHFVQGVQPTYEMPPPSTIYGHLCNATGQFEPQADIAFALHFTFEGKFRDLEYLYFEVPYIQPNPFTRELLYKPRLTLYIAPARYQAAFERPIYPVSLGRSQDLMSYTEVKSVTLRRAARAYLEHTLVPAEYAPRFRRTVAVTMAKFIDRARQPTWGKYAMLKERVFYPDEDDPFASSYEPVWIDPESPQIDGLHRGLIFHRFV